jgi:hypothetical protein
MDGDDLIRKTASTLLAELVHGSAADQAWVLNPNDPGLLASLEGLSASDASRARPGGGPPIAAHVDHLRYGLQLLNRWAAGENPFADADYSASWRLRTVSAEEWEELLRELRREAERWSSELERPRVLEEEERLGILASVAHLAYHLGAMRQIDRSIGGPRARD